MPMRILIADDHTVVRQGLRMLLALDPELEVVGEAADGAEAVQLARRLQPDLVLMDLQMPRMDGVAATAAIRRELPRTQVLALTSMVEDAKVVGAVRAGAIGYLLKDTRSDELIRAIKGAAGGEAQLSRAAAERLMREVRAPTGDPARAERDAAVQARLQQYVPGELLAKLEDARARRSMEGERRIVTMLFCDVQGSTAMAEGLDPEEWAEVMNAAFAHLIAPVYRYEGTVARLMGDAILAFFGAPIAHEDDPRRAVLAGLDIVAGIAAYRERHPGQEVQVRVGINTGLVVVGEVGSDLRVEYTAMGDAANLAARMEQTAEPGTVRITGSTHRLVAPLFEVEPPGRAGRWSTGCWRARRRPRRRAGGSWRGPRATRSSWKSWRANCLTGARRCAPGRRPRPGRSPSPIACRRC